MKRTDADKVSTGGKLKKQEGPTSSSAPGQHLHLDAGLGSSLGQRLREVRAARQMSLQDLSKATGLSRAFLSQVESGKVSPSVVSVSKITEGLGLSMSGFFMPPIGGTEGMVKATGRQHLAFEQEGSYDELLSPSIHGKTLCLLSTVLPGADSGRIYTDDAGEECIVILEGLLEVQVEEVVHQLAPGDALTFKCSRPHAWRNKGETKVVALWAITPPAF